MRVLAIGDVIGHNGIVVLQRGLKELTNESDADFVMANGENVCDCGRGIDSDELRDLFLVGVDVVTSGNHIWQKSSVSTLLDDNHRLLRPANYPNMTPGRGICYIDVKGVTLCVINLIGRVRMPVLVDCPFQFMKNIISSIHDRTPNIFLDFHAEETQEKEALAYMLAGSVTAVFGTHTHIQSADARIIDKSTAFQSDLGIVGAAQSVIGYSVESALSRAVRQIPTPPEIETRGPMMINGALVEFDEINGCARSIQSINYYL